VLSGCVRLLNGAFRVPSAMGKSRSATVLVAYLMRSRRIGVEEAVRLVREIRPFVEPNPGFLKQLELYYEMEYATDLEHPVYKRWLHQQELAQSMAAKRPPGRVHFRDSEKAAPEGATPEQAGPTELRCKRCRYCLPPAAACCCYELHGWPVHASLAAR